MRRDEDVEVRAEGVPAEVEGPVSEGERLGTAIVTVDGGRETRVPLLAARSAEAASLIERIDAALPGSARAPGACSPSAALALRPPDRRAGGLDAPAPERPPLTR